MGRPTGPAFSACFVLALMACGADGASAPAAKTSEPVNAERQTIRVSRTDGQTGMEGSCLRVPDPQPFSPDDVRALVEGTHTTTLAYRAERLAAGASLADAVGLEMTVRVELQGEPRPGRTGGGESCNLRIDQDVEVTLSFDEPALDVVIATEVSAFSSTFAVVQSVLGSDFAEALGLPSRDVTLSLAFDESGIDGSFENDVCGSAVFPANVRCPEWSEVEVDLNDERHGVRPLELLSVIDELSDVPLAWSDGTETTLTVSLADAPEWACSNAWVETFCPETLRMPVTLRAVTADGRLDAELPAELSLDVATPASATDGSCGAARTAGEIEGITLTASYLGVAAGEPAPGVIPPLDANMGLWLRVSAAPPSPDGTSAEVGVLGVERRDRGLTPPLDATAVPAGASCFGFAPFEGVETE